MIADDASETDSFYLRLSDIKDGVIEESLPKLKTVNKELERYRLVDNDIILSRNGAPFKVAIFHYNDDEKVYPVGNMYILRADPVKINPYYLKAFLESEQGGACLKYSLTGIRIQVISLEKLKKMIIPVPPMEEQELVAKRYLAIKDEIEILKIKMKAAKDRLVHVLDSVKAGE
jgi:type I restriction enzyme M protein